MQKWSCVSVFCLCLCFCWQDEVDLARLGGGGRFLKESCSLRGLFRFAVNEAGAGDEEREDCGEDDKGGLLGREPYVRLTLDDIDILCQVGEEEKRRRDKDVHAVHARL